MYVRRAIRFRHLIANSWGVLVVVALWSVVVVYLHEVLRLKWLVIPVLPVTLIGIAVSLYLGFKGVSGYNRWWEARTAVGGLVTQSRVWMLRVLGLIDDEARTASPAAVARELIYRHLAYVHAVAHRLRRTSRLKPSARTRVFGYRRGGDPAAAAEEDPQWFGRFLDSHEYAAARAASNPATHILTQQSERLRQLAQAGCLDSVRQVALAAPLAELALAQGICERIKNTPFPRQIAHFGTVFTWIFVFLLPLAFLDVFEAEAKTHRFSQLLTHEYMFTLVPFAMLIAWIFVMMEKIGDSTEDPFEGGANDVPLAAICRAIEIELRQALGETDVPPPLAPVDDVLY